MHETLAPILQNVVMEKRLYKQKDNNYPSMSMCIPGLVMQIGNLSCIKKAIINPQEAN
jgi:hypothetical protein